MGLLAVYERCIRTPDMDTTTTPSSAVAPDATLSAIEAKRAELAALEAKHAAEQKAKITSLPAQLGYKNMNALVMALLPYTRGLSLGTPEASPAPKKAVKKAAKGKGGGRSKISDDVRAKIIADIRAGGMTGAAIAAKYGIALPTLSLIKRRAGLTKPKA